MQTRVLSNPSHQVARGIGVFDAVPGHGLKLTDFIPVPFPGPRSIEEAAANMFEAAYGQIEHEVVFDVKWGNGSGYLDGVCIDARLQEELKPGEFGRTTDEYNRKVILIGTRYGAVAIFQRYVNDSTVLVYNLPFEVRQMRLIDPSGRLGYDDLLTLLGKPGKGNIGQLVQEKVASTTA